MNTTKMKKAELIKVLKEQIAKNIELASELKDAEVRIENLSELAAKVAKVSGATMSNQTHHQVLKDAETKVNNLALELLQLKKAAVEGTCARSHVNARVTILDKEIKKGKKAAVYAIINLIIEQNGTPIVEIPYTVLKDLNGRFFVADPRWDSPMVDGNHVTKCPKCEQAITLNSIVKSHASAHPLLLNLIAVKQNAPASASAPKVSAPVRNTSVSI